MLRIFNQVNRLGMQTALIEELEVLELPTTYWPSTHGVVCENVNWVPKCFSGKIILSHKLNL